LLADILSRHRGPFLFCICRPVEKAKNWVGDRYASEWLKSEVQSEDVGAEAMSLLTDPRDTICHVAVWSQKENQFITGIKSEKDL
jgi:hypothetical protein